MDSRKSSRKSSNNGSNKDRNGSCRNTNKSAVTTALINKNAEYYERQASYPNVDCTVNSLTFNNNMATVTTNNTQFSLNDDEEGSSVHDNRPNNLSALLTVQSATTFGASEESDDCEISLNSWHEPTTSSGHPNQSTSNQHTESSLDNEK